MKCFWFTWFMLCSFWKIKTFSVGEGNISDCVGEEPTAKNTMKLKHFQLELPVNDKIVSDFFVVSDIDCLLVYKIKDFTVILHPSNISSLESFLLLVGR